jgi:hypothetical protein
LRIASDLSFPDYMIFAIKTAGIEETALVVVRLLACDLISLMTIMPWVFSQ